MIQNGVFTFIHLKNLRHNIQRLLAQCKNILPIIKSDAYGHGILRTAQVMEEEGISMLAVGTVGEGTFLRENNIRSTLISLLGVLDSQEVLEAEKMCITPLVHSFEELDCIENSGASLDIAVKLDTGMKRLGFTLDEMPLLIERLQRLPQLNVHFALSHLACADEDGKDDTTVRQMRIFEKSFAMLRTAFPDIRPSLLNSAGLLIWNEIQKSAPELASAEFGRYGARPGLILYGENPLCGTQREALGASFLPVMEVQTRILTVRTLHKGESLSYGHTFTADREMRIAIIAAGYADGYARALSGKGMVALKNGRAPIVGRVCMQMTFIDVTNLQDVKPSDPVWILGGPENTSVKPITASELALRSGMIPYEFLCALGKNNRVYVG